MKKLTCLKCGHKWVQRTDKKPAKCPHCFNVNWDKPRKSDVQ